MKQHRPPIIEYRLEKLGPGAYRVRRVDGLGDVPTLGIYSSNYAAREKAKADAAKRGSVAAIILG